uniref:Uncharacterized protein n=1 Tax=Romanomermis culicivorax TaxID=13658 RepID=A0A915JD12_ROMCU
MFTAILYLMLPGKCNVRLNWYNEPIFVEANGDQDEVQKWSLNRTVSNKQTNMYPLGAYDNLDITFIFNRNTKKCNIEL